MVVLAAQPVEAAQYNGAADHASLELIFARIVEQQHPHGQRQQPLSRYEQHEEAARQQQYAEQVLSDQQHQSQHGVAPVPGGGPAFPVNEIFRGNAAGQPGQAEQAHNKYQCREAAEQRQEFLLLLEKVPQLSEGGKVQSVVSGSSARGRGSRDTAVSSASSPKHSVGLAAPSSVNTTSASAALSDTAALITTWPQFCRAPGR